MEPNGLARSRQSTSKVVNDTILGALLKRTLTPEAQPQSAPCALFASLVVTDTPSYMHQIKPSEL